MAHTFWPPPDMSPVGANFFSPFSEFLFSRWMAVSIFAKLFILLLYIAYIWMSIKAIYPFAILSFNRMYQVYHT